MIKKIGVCVQCGRKSSLNSKDLCSDCVYLNNHGKTRFQVKLEQKNQKQIKPLKKKKMIVKTAKNSLYDVFLEIWDERFHVCNNCGEDLEQFIDRETGNPSVILFSHIRSRGAAPELKYDKTNIELLCPTCHRLWEFGNRTEFEKRKI